MNLRPLFTLLALIAVRSVIAAPAIVYDGGEIEAVELNRYMRLIDSPYEDTIATYLETTDSGTRENAGYFLDLAGRELVWNRHYMSEAEAHRYKLDDSYAKDVTGKFEGCVWSHMQAKAGDSVTTLTLSQMNEYFDRYGASFERPQRTDVWYIFRQADATLPEEEKSKIREALQAVRARIVSGDLKFEDAARQYSEAASSAKGGALGAIAENQQMNEQMRDAIFRQAPDSVGDVQYIRNGYYLIKTGPSYPARHYEKNEIAGNQSLQKLLLSSAQLEAWEKVKQDASKDFPASSGLADAMAREAEEHGIRVPDCEADRDLRTQQLTAHFYFYRQIDQQVLPTEQELKEYYEKNPEEMKGDGIWQLTRFQVSLKNLGGAKFSNRDEAAAGLAAVRSAVAQKSAEENLLRNFSSTGLEIFHHMDWIHTTDSRPFDDEILERGVGELTDVHITNDGAAFYRIDAKRDPPILSFEEMRGYIARNVEHLNRMAAKKKDQEALWATLHGKETWRESANAKPLAVGPPAPPSGGSAHAR